MSYTKDTRVIERGDYALAQKRFGGCYITHKIDHGPGDGAMVAIVPGENEPWPDDWHCIGYQEALDFAIALIQSTHGDPPEEIGGYKCSMSVKDAMHYNSSDEAVRFALALIRAALSKPPVTP